MLTSNASDIGAMLAGVREHHDTLVSALEGEPAAAASLADSGVLNALQVSDQRGWGMMTTAAEPAGTSYSGSACPLLSWHDAAGQQALDKLAADPVTDAPGQLCSW
jgi:hypothetical protein